MEQRRWVLMMTVLEVHDFVPVSPTTLGVLFTSAQRNGWLRLMSFESAYHDTKYCNP